MKTILEATAITMGATIVTSTFHHFSPLGVSGVVIIMESHLTIHTWPEHHYAAVDIFTCGELDMAAGVAFLVEQMGVGRVEQRILERGGVL